MSEHRACFYCGKPFAAKRKDARFCTPSHRVLYNRLSVEERARREQKYSCAAAAADNTQPVSPALPVEISPAPDTAAPPQVVAIPYTPPDTIWVKPDVQAVLDYCEQQGIELLDLIAFHKAKMAEAAKKKEAPPAVIENKPEEKGNKDGKSVVPYWMQRQREKLK